MFEKWKSAPNRSFGDSCGSGRERRVVEYVLQEEYVRRRSTPAGSERLLRRQELGEGARKGLRRHPGKAGHTGEGEDLRAKGNRKEETCSRHP